MAEPKFKVGDRAVVDYKGKPPRNAATEQGEQGAIEEVKTDQAGKKTYIQYKLHLDRGGWAWVAQQHLQPAPDDPYITPVTPRDERYTVTLEPGDAVEIEADDDLSGEIAIVMRTLPDFQIEVDLKGVQFAYDRRQLKLFERADERSIAYLKTLQTGDQFAVGDTVEIINLSPDQPALILLQTGVINQIEAEGITVSISGFPHPIVLQPDQIRPYIPPPPPRPSYNEGDRVRGKLVKNPDVTIEGRVEYQVTDAVFVSFGDSYEVAGVLYDGLELLEAAEPSDAPADPLAEFFAAIGEELAPAEPVSAEIVPPADIEAELTELADRANTDHEACEAASFQALYAARSAGETLAIAREKIRHSKQRNWLAWLAQNFRGSQRTAYNYLKIAESWEEAIAPHLSGESNLQRDSTSPPLGIRQALALLGQQDGEVDEPPDEPAAPNVTPLSQTYDTPAAPAPRREAGGIPPQPPTPQDEIPLPQEEGPIAPTPDTQPPTPNPQQAADQTAPFYGSGIGLNIASGQPCQYKFCRSDAGIIEAKADFLVLRLDTDEQARNAAIDYANYISLENPEFAQNIRDRVRDHRWETT